MKLDLSRPHITSSKASEIAVYMLNFSKHIYLIYLGDIHLFMFLNLHVNDLLLRSTVLVTCPVSLSFSGQSEIRELASLPGGPRQLWDLSPSVRHLDDGREIGGGVRNLLRPSLSHRLAK